MNPDSHARHASWSRPIPRTVALNTHLCLALKTRVHGCGMVLIQHCCSEMRVGKASLVVSVLCTHSSDSTAWWSKRRKPEDSTPQLRHQLCAKPTKCGSPIQILLLRPQACDPNSVLSRRRPDPSENQDGTSTPTAREGVNKWVNHHFEGNTAEKSTPRCVCDAR